MTTGWKIVFVVLFLLAVAGGGLYVGKRLELTTTLAAKNKELANANQAITALETKYRAQETAWADAFATVSKEYQNAADKIANQKNADIADARNGTLRLSVFADHNAGGNSAPTSAPAAGGSDEGDTSYLSPTVTDDLFALADDADDAANTLALCQATLIAERKQP